MLYIHPDECIDCEACVPECPVEAIFHEDDLPEEWNEYIQINAEQSEQCEVITERKEPLKKGLSWLFLLQLWRRLANKLASA